MTSRNSDPSLPLTVRLDDASYQANSDVVEGMRFCATLHLSTPLEVLRHHDEVFHGPPSQAPKYGSQADGIWVFKTKSLRDLGLPLDFPESVHASDIGQVKPSEYLPFLLRFRSIVEADDELELKSSRLSSLQHESPQFNKIWQRLAKKYVSVPRRPS